MVKAKEVRWWDELWCRQKTQQQRSGNAQWDTQERTWEALKQPRQKSSGDLLLLFNCSMYIYEWMDSFLFDLRVSHSQVYKEVPSCIDSVHKKITIYLSILKQSTFYLPSSLVLLSHFSRVRLCATPETAAHHAPPSLGFSRQEHWSELPFPSPMQESEKWKWSRSVLSNS